MRLSWLSSLHLGSSHTLSFAVAFSPLAPVLLARTPRVPSSETTVGTQAAAAEAAAEIDSKKAHIVAVEGRLLHGGEAIDAQRQEKERERLAVTEATAAARAETEAARTLLRQRQARTQGRPGAFLPQE